MDKYGDHAREIRALSERLGPIQFTGESGVTATPRYSPDYERAALMSSFDPDDLHLGNEVVRSLLRDSVAIVADQAVRYVLNPDVRRNVLRQLGSRQRMQDALDSVETLPSDGLQQAIKRIVADDAVVEPGAPIGRLQTAYQALSWFAGIIDTPPPEELRSRIEAVGYLERFERLVGDNFSGREDDLQELRDYVGVLPGGEGIIARVLQRWKSFDEKPALVITGPGGIGKSTLLAKFILDHATRGELPFVYVNFDSPIVRAGDPKTILLEGLRQLAIEYPDFSRTITQLRDRWQAELVELIELAESARRNRDRELATIIRDELVSMLSSLQLADRPLLLVLDTFEVVQERQRGDIATLYDFLHGLQRVHPALRVVISGRAAPEDAPVTSDDVATLSIRTQVLELKGLDRATSTDYLTRAGLSPEHAAEVAGYLVPEEAADEGASPLSLRVAAEVWTRDLERAELDSSFWAQLRAGRIQAQLITRYLRHTDQSSLAGQLALPSMLLRRIDAPALSAVVAPAWDIHLWPGQPNNVLGELAKLISLVLERGGRALQPRPEVQRQVVDLLTDAETDKVARLHQLAVDHYAATSLEQPDQHRAAEARFDEIVHRLARGDAESVVRERWTPACAEFVTGRIPLLTNEAQAVLEQLAGFELTQAMRDRASLQVWEGEAILRSRRALEAGTPQLVVKITGDRDDWEKAGELSLLLARAHLALGQPLDALDAAATALSRPVPEVTSALVLDLHLVATEAAYALDRPQDVLDSTDDALLIAREREDLPRTISALLLQLRVQRDRAMASATTSARELQAATATYDGQLPEADLQRLLSLLDSFPGLLPAAIRLGGLRLLTPQEARQIARLVTAVDTEASANRGEKPGLLALTTGLSVGTSVTRTWQDALQRADLVAQRALIQALEQDVSTSAELTRQLVISLEEAATTGTSLEKPSSGKTATRLNQRRRVQLVDALLSELGVGNLDGILADEFDRSLGSLTSLDMATEDSVGALVEAAERDGWLAALVIAARNRQPSAPQLFQVANELDLTALHFPAGRLARSAAPRELSVVLANLGMIEGQIGRVERHGRLAGTGLLVSPNLLLLAASTIDDGRQASNLVVRFGLKADAKGRPFDDGTAYPVTHEGLVDVIEHEGGSGFALLRLDDYPADEPLGSGRGEQLHLRRGFANISRWAEMSEGQNALVCWQQRSRLELHIERRALKKVGSSFTLPSLGSTSEGAPCFNRSMEFLGLVLENRGPVARVASGKLLWHSMMERGHGEAVGVPLA